MVKKYIKQPIPSEISEEGGAIAVFVEKDTIPLDTSIREAIRGNYTMGQESLIRNNFFGLMKSMIEGLLTDGHSRSLAGLITVYLVCKGEFDLEKGWDNEKNSLMVRARLLNELDLDITNWVFQDVTEGKRAFTLTTFEAGDEVNTFVPYRKAALNGNDVPNTSAGEEIRIDWELEGTEKAGTIAANKVTSTATRIDIAEGTLTDLNKPEYDGKMLKFTVRGNYSNAVKRVKVVYSELPEIVVDETLVTLDAANHKLEGEINGSNLKLVEGDSVWYDVEVGGQGFHGPATVTESTDEQIKFEVNEEDISAEWAGQPFGGKLKARGGNPSDPQQEITLEGEIEG